MVTFNEQTSMNTLSDIDFVRDLLWNDHPECCGSPVVGAEYMGQQEMICCGCPEPTLLNDAQIVASLRARFPEPTQPPTQDSSAETWECPDCHKGGCKVGRCAIGCRPPPTQESWQAARSSVGERAEQVSIRIDFRQATELLAMFGGEPGEITLSEPGGSVKAHSGPGLYAYHADYPEEGSIHLGVTDEEATPTQESEQSDYEAIEREHFGDAEKGTGIYAPPSPAAPREITDAQIDEAWNFATGGTIVTNDMRAFARVVAALASSAQAGAGEPLWQPIDTAPKDGTYFLSWHSGSISMTKWRLGIFGKEWCWGGQGWSFAQSSQPTHWMPLPAGPGGIGKAAAKGEEANG